MFNLWLLLVNINGPLFSCINQLITSITVIFHGPVTSLVKVDGRPSGANAEWIRVNLM